MLSLLMKDETVDQIHIEQRKIFNYKLGSGCAVPWDELAQEYFHAGASSAFSDRSRTRQARSRVTDGKHFRNSSKE